MLSSRLRGSQISTAMDLSSASQSDASFLSDNSFSF
jgi:hypothetical protein